MSNGVLSQERVPPHNVAVEQALLGGIMLAVADNDAALLVSVLEGVSEEAFYAEAHQKIFRAISALHARAQLPDLLSVTDCLRQYDELDAVGGAAYVTSLLDATPTSALLPQHLEIVRRDWRKRVLADLGWELRQAALNGHDPGELVAVTRRMAEEMDSNAVSLLERGRGGIESAADLLERDGGAEQMWFPLWGQDGFIGPGLFVLLSGHSKVAGKSTTMSLGVRDLIRQQPDLRVLILSEEPRSLWRTRLARWGDVPNLRLWIADGTPWPRVLARLRQETLDLLVVDTLRSFAGIADENDAAKVVAAVQPLVLLARTKGMGVLALHHLRKSEAEEGLGHAGSTALVALADVALELRRDEHAEARRILRAVTRFEETPRALSLEKRGDEIMVLGAPERVALQEVTERVLAILPVADDPGLTQEGVREALGDPKPSVEQTRKALTALHAQNRVAVEGKGRKGSPYRWTRVQTFHSPTTSSIDGGMAFQT